MAIFSDEFKTNKIISKPPKPIPFVDSEEILFLQVNLILGIIILLFIGIIQNILKTNGFGELPRGFVKTTLIFVFAILPIALFTLMKIIKIGKPPGFLEQKIVIYFKSSLLNVLDFRDKEDRNYLKDTNSGIWSIIKNKEWLNNRKYNGKKIEFKYNKEDEFRHFEETKNTRYKKLLSSYANKKKFEEKNNKEVNQILEQFLSFKKDN